jgi:signal transduction histidine kinase
MTEPRPADTAVEPPPRGRLGPRAPWLLLPVVWLVAALVSTAPGGRLIDHGRITVQPWTSLFREQLVAFGWWAVLSPLVILAVRRIERWRAGIVPRLAAHAGAALAFIALYFELRANVELPFSEFRLSPGLPGLRSILPGAVGTYLLIAAGTAAFTAHARALARERRASRLETQLAEARLHVLRAQLQPHFLFNALHAVSALVDWRPKEARRMLTSLSELLRLALELSEAAEIALTQEVDWLERYLDLQQIRYEERLAVDVRIAADAIAAAVPPLLLQPLVENAIKHAIEPRADGGRVEISAERDGARLRLRVRDDGPGPGAAAGTAGAGIGLRNTRDRLRALYGDAQRVELRLAAGGGAEVVVELPYHEAPLRSGRPNGQAPGTEPPAPSVPPTEARAG